MKVLHIKKIAKKTSQNYLKCPGKPDDQNSFCELYKNSLLIIRTRSIF